MQSIFFFWSSIQMCMELCCSCIKMLGKAEPNQMCVSLFSFVLLLCVLLCSFIFCGILWITSRENQSLDFSVLYIICLTVTACFGKKNYIGTQSVLMRWGNHFNHQPINPNSKNLNLKRKYKNDVLSMLITIYFFVFRLNTNAITHL